MNKIKTIFERDWDGTHKVVDKYIEGFTPEMLEDATATEKLDGTNVRVTVRNGMCMRLEKRRNPDGEWSGECLGLNVQGNPLKLDKNIIVFFSLGQAPVFENAPTSYGELMSWLPKQKSKFGNDCGIEGIVWYCPNGDMYKIKCKDFSTDERK